MELPIVFHDRRKGVKATIQLPITQDDTIESVEQKLSSIVNIPVNNLKVLFCGKLLGEKTRISDLLLGPTTCLVALSVEEKSLDEGEERGEHSGDVGSFYVWCKPCDRIEKGKLRVYCAKCESGAVLVTKEPECWNDVLRSGRIQCFCEDCGSEQSAQFKFKCVRCSDISAPLCHIRGNWEKTPCGICSIDTKRFVFDLGCNHATCRQCFQQYLTLALMESRFIFVPAYGYTATCPFPGCDNCIKDLHHLRILGTEKYKLYQTLATEKLIALDDEGVFCPYPNCKASFFWNSEDDDGNTSCPECLRLFCRLCRSITCICRKDDDLTQNTIEATTKKCPGCSADTERSGGCAHMHCTSCGMDWCFRCVKQWTEECQWDHWFD